MTSKQQDRLREVLQKTNELAQYAATGDYLYRGEPKCYERVSSSLYRKYSDIEVEFFNVKIVQEEILKEAKGFVRETDDDAILEQLQHFGYPTNQIDFTKDYHIALFFACDSQPLEDGRVLLLRKADRGDLYKPNAPENRVIAQKSVFVRPPKGLVHPDYTVVIPKELKRPILEYLDRNHGINASTVFNDLHGFIKYRSAHESAYAKFYSGLTQHYKGEYDKAIESYSRSIDLNSGVSVAYSNRGISYMEKGDYAPAIEDHSRAIELNPGNARSYYDRGLAYDKSGDHIAAIQDYTIAIELDLGYADAYNNRALAYMHLGEFGRAIQDCDRVIELEPNSPTHHLGRGFAYFGKGDFDSAIEDYNKALQIDPRLATAYYNRGLTYQCQGNHDRAIQDFNKAIELEPSFPVAYWSRGVSLLCERKWGDTEPDLSRAQNLGVDIVSAFRDKYGSVSQFEQDNGIQFPENIKAMLTPNQ